MISARSVGKVFENTDPPIHALRDINLTIERGEFVAIVGPSGSGKSTLLNLLGCLDRPSSGAVFLLVENTSTLTDSQLSRVRNRSIGFVFQMYNLVPEMTVRENVEMPLVYAGVTRGRRATAMEALEQVHLVERAEQRASLLSGGELQRAAIARALVNNPALILADEPTGNVDRASAGQLLALFSSLHDRARTIVMVTHDGAAAAYAQRVLSLEAGTLHDRTLSRQELSAQQADDELHAERWPKARFAGS